MDVSRKFDRESLINRSYKLQEYISDIVIWFARLPISKSIFEFFQ